MASPAYERRNARARELGYRNYYDYRVHRNGTIPPGEPAAPSGSARNLARGHAGRAELNRLLNRLAGQRIQPTVFPVGQERDSRGRYVRIHIQVLWEDRAGRVHERNFYLRGRQASEENLVELRGQLAAAGATVVNAPSIDVFSGERVDVDEFDVDFDFDDELDEEGAA